MSNYSSQEIEEYSQVFGALSNPNRLKIFLILRSCCVPGVTCKVGEQSTCVGEIGKELKIAPSTVSHHLKELTRAGLIKTERRGQKVECWVDPEISEQWDQVFAQKSK